VRDEFNISATVAADELVRDDPGQFRLGATNASYEGLGLFNLDLLTAETRSVTDRVAVVDVGGSFPQLDRFVSWGVSAGWHRRAAELATSGEEDVGVLARTSRFVHLGGNMGFWDNHVRLRVEGGWDRAAAATASERTTNDLGASMGVDLTTSLRLVAGGGRGEQIPWLPLPDGGPVETRTSWHVGLEHVTLDGRYTTGVSLFHDRVEDFTDRDWAAERAALDASGVPGAIRYHTVAPFERAGVMGRLEWMPLRELALRATFYFDARDEGPVRGGNHRGSLLACYRFRSGWLRGFFLGANATYHNTLRFADGYAQRGGWRNDLFLGWERGAGGRTQIQLNVVNLGDRPDRATRFAPERGRQWRVTIAQQF
jgi:hypothetical protein